MRVCSIRVIASVIVRPRTARPQLESLISGRPCFRPTSRAFLAGIRKRSSRATTYRRTCSLSTPTRTLTSSPLCAKRTRDRVVDGNDEAEAICRDAPALLSHPKAQGRTESRADLLARLLGVEPGDVDPRDRDADADRPGRPRGRSDRDGREEDEHERERGALPERHAHERDGDPLHEPDVTSKRRLWRVSEAAS